jgi:hypothetical protein
MADRWPYRSEAATPPPAEMALQRPSVLHVLNLLHPYS